MSQYMLLIYPPADTPPRENTLERWQAFNDAVHRDGVLVTSGRLQALESATSVRVRHGETLVSDGPFAETKEYLGGFYLIEADNIDDAIEFASKIPAARSGGAIEVRPVVEH